MKRKFILFIIITLSNFQITKLFAQAPDKLSYQAVIRNTNNALVTNQNVGMRMSILQTSASGTAVYVETQTATTNNNGLASTIIGNGTVVSGTITAIDWSSGNYFLKVETDPTGGTNYTISSTTQLLSVPYALHSKSSFDNQWNKIGNNIFNKNSGTVSIGTTLNLAKLHVAAVSGNALRLDATGGNTALGIGGSGVVAVDAISTFGGRFYIAENGNVGIGTNNPTTKLFVNGSSGGTALRIESGLFSNSLSIGGNGAVSVDAPNVVGGRFLINDNGSVGIGINNPPANVKLFSRGGYAVFDFNSSTGPGGVISGVPTASNAGALIIGGNFSGGRGEVSFLNAGAAGSNVGYSFHHKAPNGTYSEDVRFDQDGSTHATFNFLWSDKNLKRNIKAIESQTANKLLSLKTYTYQFDSKVMDEKHLSCNNDLHYGVLAQELEQLYPSMVKTDEKGIKSVNYTELIPLMISMLQEQQKRIEALERKN